ncbi:MAG TPA: copper-containing nitrite reductase [Opitutaceae bacterium]|nr:copper-containing nitrite reductase [Opitutaceae bacterium]
MHKRRFLIALSAAALLGAAGCSRPLPPHAYTADEAAALPVEYALLTPPPTVPGAIRRDHPAHVIVDLEVRELVRQLADGVTYTYWTFGGTVPGLFIRVREGDYVEVRLHNHPSSKMPHNIDLHAVSGPGGGAAASFTAPGHTSTFAFTAMNPGLYVYHCATAPVPMHVGNGMYGLILVEPKGGLPPVDHEYYLMQGEVYTAGRYGEPGLQAFDPEKAADERPPYVVFNGSVGAVSGDGALQARTGERVRIFFGDGGPNLTSSFHVIGQIFSTVYPEAGMGPVEHNVQTTTVPPGGATIVELTTRVPGNFAIVDHALSRAFGKGALGLLAVSGPAMEGVFSGKLSDAPYSGGLFEGYHENVAPAPLAAADDLPPGAPLTKAIQLKRGQRVFNASCIACHQANGKGLPGVYPPLAGSDFLRERGVRSAVIPIKGLSGAITVNGKTYNNLMPPQPYSDAQIADVLTFVMNSWGNDWGRVLPDDVKQARAGLN